MTTVARDDLSGTDGDISQVESRDLSRAAGILIGIALRLIASPQKDTG